MDIQSLAANAKTAWARRASPGDFVRRMMWLYSSRLPSRLARLEWTIGCSYPAPIGCLQLCLRSNGGADAFIHSEIFEHEYYRLPLHTAPKTILDLGANTGLSAIYFARLFPHAELACVEPEPDNLRVLNKNLELNNVRAVVIPAAVDTSDGRALLELGERDYAHRIVVPTPSAAAKPALEVEAVSVPTILRHLSWERIGLLKVDIEGHEDALFACDCDWLECVDAMCIEWHVEGGAERLAALAQRFGFGAPRQLPIWFMTRQTAA
jgi:FkbM family methyltransferase